MALIIPLPVTMPFDPLQAVSGLSHGACFGQWVTWVDLEVDWETQLMFPVSLLASSATVEGFTQVRQLRNGQPWPAQRGC